MVRSSHWRSHIDPALVQRAQGTDPVIREAARHELVRLLRPLVEEVVARLGTPRWLREDARQEGYVGVFEALKRFDPNAGTPFGQFAYSFVLGSVRSYVHPAPSRSPRSSQVRPLHHGDRPRDADVPDVYEGELASALAVDPLDEMIDVERIFVVEAFLSALSPQQMRVVRLCFWNNQSQAAAAHELGCSPMTVSRLMASVRVVGLESLAGIAA